MSWWDSGPIEEMAIDEHERRLQRLAGEVPERALADRATTALALVIERSAQRNRPESGSPDSFDLHGLMGIAVLTFRASRAAMAVIATGYESEANRHLRSVVELNAPRKAMEGDTTGAEARAWLEGRRGGRITAGPGRWHYQGPLRRAVRGRPWRSSGHLPAPHAEGRRRARSQLGPHRGMLSRLLLHQFAFYSLLAAMALGASAGVDVPLAQQLHRDLATAAAQLKRLVPGTAPA